jgi:hypothetical protein
MIPARCTIIDALADGTVPAASVWNRLADLAQRRLALENRLAAAPLPAPRLHPDVAEVCREKVAALAEVLAREAVSGLVEAIIPVPGNGGLRVEIRGGLAAILVLSSAVRSRSAGRRRSGGGSSYGSSAGDDGGWLPRVQVALVLRQHQYDFPSCTRRREDPSLKRPDGLVSPEQNRARTVRINSDRRGITSSVSVIARPITATSWKPETTASASGPPPSPPNAKGHRNDLTPSGSRRTIPPMRVSSL